ncbi:hypothetical protein [Shewanella surugensis]|uniref:Lipoprotein n=1 Tax=Shewanella surugensis TaxID=212020 RepID=A0ABT0LDC0_9GAMM|nr:hypothetical protein [Shewanella surugensis]MCL1125692.1 hypothetical protein [Shewanella surugensis]
MRNPFIALTMLFLLTACDIKNDPVLSAFSFLSSPQSKAEDISRAFFEAIYINQDLKQAKQYVAPPLRSLLTHYAIPSSVQRHLFNLSLTDVSLEVTDPDLTLFTQFEQNIIVTIKLFGLKNNQTWIDDRSVRLQYSDSRWLIIEILPEKKRNNHG